MTACILVAALAFTYSDAQSAYDTARELVEKHTPRDSGTPGGRAAAEFLLEQARKAAGASAPVSASLDEFEENGKKYRNVTAGFEPVPDGEWLVFVSHFDTKPRTGCPGANDGASTSGLLAAMLRAAVRAHPSESFPHNFLFIWTDGEECAGASYSERDGLAGSRRAAERLAKSGRRVKGVVCLDMLGDRDLFCTIPVNGSSRLRAAAFEASRDCGVPLGDCFLVVTDDHVPFMEAGFEAIDIIDFEYGPAASGGWWHTPRDTMDKIDAKSLFAAGRLAFSISGRLAARRAPR